MTPLRAAVLKALEQECRVIYLENVPRHFTTDAQCVLYGATVSAISSRVDMPGLVRSSDIRRILHEERDAGRVLQNDTGTTHRWWPVGFCGA